MAWKYKERGLLSSKTATVKSRDESKTVTASTLSGDAVQITADGIKLENEYKNNIIRRNFLIVIEAIMIAIVIVLKYSLL